MRFRETIATVIALCALACCPVAGASTFRAPIEPPTIDPGCDYGSTNCEYGSNHTGIDYLGDDPPHEPVLAVADGFVAVAATPGESHGFGNAVILRHSLPGGGTVYSLYGHMAAAPDVSVGDCVRGGTSLGTQGDSGDTLDVSTHFEFKTQARFGPPYGYSDGWPDAFGYFDPKSFIGKRDALDVCTPKPASPCGAAAHIGVSHPGTTRAHGFRAAGLVRTAPGCRVELSLEHRSGKTCRSWRGFRRGMRSSPCSHPGWVRVSHVGDGRWSYRFGHALHTGRYRLRVRLRGASVADAASARVHLD